MTRLLMTSAAWTAVLAGSAFAQAPAPAGATQTQGSATAAAGDAFGERVGIEQVGLYTEGQVRGFDLQASGAYRVEGHYFARNAPLPDAVLSGVGVRVGVNAAALDLPSPSGVVNYRLREPVRTGGEVSLGLRDYGTVFAEGLGSWVSEDGKLGVVADVLLRPVARWAPGTRGEAYNAGIVGRWRPDPNTRVRAFAGYYTRTYDGDWAMLAKDAAVPPPAEPNRNYSPSWAAVTASDLNLGLLADRRFTGGWVLDLSAFRSTHQPQRTDFTLVRADRTGAGEATLFYSPSREFASDSAEARLAKVFSTGDFDHRISVSARGRRTRTELARSLALPVGPVNLPLGLSAGAPRPDLPARTASGEDAVDQVTASLGYGVNWREGLQLRLGAHRTRYEKTVTGFDGAVSARTQERWFYNASAIWDLNRRLSLFGSYVTGLEEAGVAPASAINRNEVLAPVEAVQYEAGLRYALTDRLNFIGAVFDVSKPTNGLRADGVFGPIGEVRHRGLEASLAGRIGENTNIVLGAVRLEPELTGPLVEAGQVGSTPPGLSRLTAVASIEHRLNPVWSVDANYIHLGERFVNTRNTFSTAPVNSVNVGVRARFEAGEHPLSLRLMIINAFDESGWYASGSELLFPVGARSLRASLTVPFG